MTRLNEGPSLLSPDHIQSLSHPDMLRLVKETDDPGLLRQMAGLRFAVEASMENNNNREPFISWPPINRGFQAWLPILLAKVAQTELAQDLSGERLMIMAIPRSATPYMHPILEYQIFPGAGTTWVLKDDQRALYGVPLTDYVPLRVPSYVRGRDPVTKTRHTEEMLFFHPERYKGQTVIVLDDAIAEGLSVVTVASFLRHELGARKVLVASPMAKIIQSGEVRIQESGLVDAISVLIHITQTHGPGGPIEYYAT